MGLPEKKFISVKEYLEAEANSREKHEYYNGEIFAMAGASVEHNLIASNVFGELYIKLKDRPCRVISSDLRIKISKQNFYTYPDINIICGEIKKTEDKSDTIVNPTAIIEILSESTKDYDRGSKFKLYREIESLRDYILIDSTGGYLVENYFKNETGIWQLSEYSNLADIFKIASIDVSISLQEIYRDVYQTL